MRIALAWGGGIGSLLALDEIAAHDVTLVHVPLPPERAAHVPTFIVEAQAAALGLPLVVASERGTQMGALARAVEDLGPEKVALGYLRGEEYEQYHLAAALQKAGGAALLPVRHLPPGEAARQLVEAGHRAFVRSAAPPFGAELLGRFLDAALVDEVDAAAGRRGWAAIRALAVDGPRFRRRVDVTANGPRPVGDGWRLDLGLLGC